MGGLFTQLCDLWLQYRRPGTGHKLSTPSSTGAGVATGPRGVTGLLCLPGELPSFHRVLNRSCSYIHVLVLPDADRRPPGTFKKFVGLSIAGDVTVQLLCPPSGVRLRSRPMLRADMPEAAVHEDRDASAGENDIGATSDARDDLAIHAVAQTKLMQLATQSNLRLGVAPSLPSHPAQHFR